MTMNTSAASIAPLSPAASPRSSPFLPSDTPCNLKVDNGTQLAHDNIQPLPARILDAWEEKYNRRSILLISRTEFDCLVTGVMRELEGSAATNDQLEAALAERVNNETRELKAQLEQVKRDILLPADVADELDNLLPFVQQETHHGWLQYITHTLRMLHQLYSTQQPATSEPAPMPTPPLVPTRPRHHTQRATSIQKKRKQSRAAPRRRNDRIKGLTTNGAS